MVFFRFFFIGVVLDNIVLMEDKLYLFMLGFFVIVKIIGGIKGVMVILYF